MSCRHIAQICTLVAIIFTGVAPAQAQIYSWRDDNGNLVLSNTPRDGAASVASYSVPRSETVRVTRSVPPGRTERWDDVIVHHSREQGVRPDLVRAVVQVESAYNPNAISPKGAQGLMQLMPATARELGVANPLDPAANLDGGTRYLRDLIAKYNGDLTKALAAYNAGPGAVARHQGVPPYRETQDYVKKVLRRYRPQE